MPPTNHDYHPHLLSAATMIGDRVRNEKDETLGTFEDLMIDLDTGRISYVVLSVGGFLGMGNKLLAIPMSDVRVDDKHREFVIKMEREEVAKARGFEKDEWPGQKVP